MFYSVFSTDGRSRTYWIGKDLRRSVNEVKFYENTKLLIKQNDERWGILKYCFEYGGNVILKVAINNRVSTKPKHFFFAGTMSHRFP